MEFKFRGKDKSGKWVFGDLVHDAFDGTSRSLPVAIKERGCYPVEVDAGTVGIYIGLKDKNDKEVYGGDKDSEGFVFEYNIEAGTWYRMKGGEGCHWHAQVVRQGRLPFVEIIGNIHEDLTEKN